MRFQPKTTTIYAGKEAGFDFKKNHWCIKLVNFRLDIISKINYIILVIMLHIESGFGSKNV